MAAAGACVVLGDVFDEEGQALADELARYVRLDVTSKSDWENAIAQATELFGRLEISGQLCPTGIRRHPDDTRHGDVARRMSIPLRRGAQPEDISFLALYLGSDEAAFVRGAGCVIDGGQTAQAPLAREFTEKA